MDYCIKDNELLLYEGIMENVEIPHGVEKISNHAFANSGIIYKENENPYLPIKTIFIPASVTEIEQGAFDSCCNLESFIIDENNKNYITVNNMIFTKDIKQLLFVPQNIKEKLSLPENYKNCSDFNNFLQIISFKSFAGCRNVKTITIPEGVEKIESLAFAGCEQLKSIILPETLKEIGSNAFYNCKKLEEIKIPESNKIFKFENNMIINKSTNKIVYNMEKKLSTGKKRRHSLEDYIEN